MEDANRLSINSATITSTQSIDRLPSPSRSPTRLDILLRENADLKKKLSDQSQIINALKNEIYELKQQVKNAENDTDGHAETRELILQAPSTVTTDNNVLLPPPRSANRSKFLLPTPSETKKDEELSNEISDSNNDTNLEVNHSESHVTTPIRSTPDVDWSATLAALNSSDTDSDSYDEEPTLEIAEIHSTAEVSPNIPILTVKPDSKQSSPYSGRIQSGSSATSPTKSVYSPVRSQIGANEGNQTPRSNFSMNTHNNMTPAYINESPDDQRSFSRSHDSTLLSGGSSSKYNPNSPLRSSFQRAAISTPQYSTNGIESTPGTPMTAHSIHSHNQPLSKANLYDPYTSDFPNQQPVIQDVSVNGYSNNASPYKPKLLSSPHSTQVQTPKQFSFPTDVPLFVEPHQLSTIKPDVITTIYGNPSKKSDDPIVIFSANDRASKKEMWRFKKTLSQIVLLDAEIRPMINSFSLPPIPEKALFLTNIPSKIDTRRMRIKDYFLTLFNIPNIPMDVAYKVARFMSLDVVNLLDESNTESLKDGWLLRKAKGLGNNWKARYCETDGVFINVYDSFQGSLLEIIKLTGSQIGRQPDSSSKDDKSSYRHAFAVLESKRDKSNKFTKHIFCAETDEEREAWINVLVQFTDDGFQSDSATLSSQTILGSDVSLKSPVNSPSRHTRDVSRSGEDDLYSEDVSKLNEYSKDSKKNKKRSFFPFSKKQTNNNYIDDAESIRTIDTVEESNIERSLQHLNLTPTAVVSKTIFQNELDQVIKFSKNVLYYREVPSIVYRCLKYLTDHNAVHEEGIFRLSGSAALIKTLREAFDRDYDVDFERFETKPDINTVAGLLKLWLRELPSSILTRELLAQYKAYYNNSHGDSQQLAIVFQNLTSRLPQENQNLLYVLFKFLNEVVQNKDSNKMNLRNLCIVFSPTLNLSSELVIPFLVDFKCIFEGAEPIRNEDREVLDVKIPTF